MLTVSTVSTEQFDSLRQATGRTKLRTCMIGRVAQDSNILEVLAEFADEGEGEVAARALAEHMGGVVYVKSSKRIIKFEREA